MTTAWELVPRQGIRRDGLDVFIGMDRASLRAELTPVLGEPRSHFPDEDDFRSADDGTWIRLRYDDEGLQDVEFLTGDLSFDEIPLHRGARWPVLRERFAALGFSFEGANELADGQECPALGVNIATHADVGGQGDGIEWVIVAAAIAKA